MHTLLDLHGNIPTFLHISDGKLHDVKGLCTCFRSYQHIVGHGLGFHDQIE